MSNPAPWVTTVSIPIASFCQAFDNPGASQNTPLRAQRPGRAGTNRYGSTGSDSVSLTGSQHQRETDLSRRASFLRHAAFSFLPRAGTAMGVSLEKYLGHTTGRRAYERDHNS